MSCNSTTGVVFRVYLPYSSPYWTRTQSADFPYGTRCTKEHGNLGYIRCVVMNEGIRPALRLDIGALELSGGDGTMENPYLVKR